MSARFQFSPAEDEKLTEHVASHPAVYDAGHKDYKDQMVKENIWKEISDKIERTVADCKKRWRNIRDTYMKQRKPGSKKGKSKWPLLAQLEFLNKVSYVKSTQSGVITPESNENVDKDNELSDQPEDQTEDNSIPQSDSPVGNSDKELENISTQNDRKRKLPFPKHSSKKIIDNNEKIFEILKNRSAEREHVLKSSIRQTKVVEEDPVVIFFKSMAMTVKTFPPELIVQAKSRVHSIISELELQSLRQQEFSQERLTAHNPILPDSRPGAVC